MRGEGCLLERESATASAAELVDRVSAGGSGAVFLVGEAGLGKTSVLDQACRRAARAGLTVGASRGHPMEAGLPFGVLSQALEAVGAGGLIGEEDGDGHPAAGWSGRCYRVLRWLQGRADSPLFLGIDDLHWADADSLALLSFLCRRADAVRFGLIASMRPWPKTAHETAAELTQGGRGVMVPLAPLSQQAAGMLLHARLGRPVAAAVRGRAFELSAGNPLLLEQLAVAVGKGGRLPDPNGVGMAAFGQGMLLSRFAGLPPGGMRCAQAASVLGSRFLPEIAAQVAGLDDKEVDLAIEALAGSGLVGQQPGAVAEFVHPLFRQALYDDLPGPVCSRLHARAFTVLHARGLDAQAAEHAVQAGLAGDTDAVAVLEEAGRAARRAGAVATAVFWLDKAASMAGGRASTRLLLDVAEAHLVSGSLERAMAIYRSLLARAGLEPTVMVEARWMLARALATAGRHDLAASAFTEAAQLAAGAHPATAAEVLLDAAYCAMLSAGAAPAAALAGQARELARAAGSALRARADADWAEYAVMCGDPSGIAAAEAVAASWRTEGNSALAGASSAWRGGWATAYGLTFCALVTEQLAKADHAFTLIRAEAEEACAPVAIAGMAVAHSYALVRMGRLEEALAAITVATSLTDLVPMIDAYACAGKACICLYLGRLEECAQMCERAEAISSARGQLGAQMILCEVQGHRWLREGAVAAACAAYERLEAIAHRMGIREPCVLPWPRHAVSAFMAAGRIQDAERILAWLDEIIPRLPCRFPRIAAATARAQLAEFRRDGSAADDHYRSALALHDEADLPVEHCETLLAYGGFLRRSGSPARARPLLAKAAEIAQDAGASWLARFAHDELKVAGGRLRRRPAPGQLSAQEQRVAALAATGATNADIARQLCLSVSTIETHLEHIYSKLGINTRYQLIAMEASRKQQS
jgi:DNA-binding CsgD family transcriptional regulator